MIATPPELRREPRRRDGWTRFGLALGLAFTLFAGAANAAPLSYSDLLSRARPLADRRIAYGPRPDQFGELWLPKTGKAPYPVVVLIHGGCWQASLPGLELMSYAAADLRARGFAVWNLEYRRLGETGGGYPGSFLDIARGVDALRALAPARRLDPNRIVLVGHSAGAQLALWAVGRGRLPITSALAAPAALSVRGVVSLAGIDDLAAYRDAGPSACGGAATIDQLVAADRRSWPAALADTSPAALLPLGVRQVIVFGGRDPIVPEAFARAYAMKARAAGDPVETLDLPGAGHFELIDPRSAAWKAIEPAIERLAR